MYMRSDRDYLNTFNGVFTNAANRPRIQSGDNNSSQVSRAFRPR